MQDRWIRFVTYADGQRLDAMEQKNGEAEGRVRLKFTDTAAMLAALDD